MRKQPKISDDNMVASIASTYFQIEPRNTTLQLGNTNMGFLIDSRSVCSILNEPLATEIVEIFSLSKWIKNRTC